MWRINIIKMQNREINPPKPSFQSAIKRPKRAIPKNRNPILTNGAEGVTAFFAASIIITIPTTRVKTTKRVPMIRAIHLITFKKDFFGFIGRCV